MTYERIIALLLLAFSLGYGLAATEIKLLPFPPQQQMTARTMPYLLASAGALISFLMLILPAADNAASAPRWRQLHWKKAGLILLAIVAYGIIISSLGFVLSTLAFLFFCSAVLGERRLPVLAAVYVPVVLIFWLVITQLLQHML